MNPWRERDRENRNEPLEREIERARENRNEPLRERERERQQQ